MALSRRAAEWALVATLLAPCSPANAADAVAAIEVPGGIAAVSRVVGHVDYDPARFVVDLNTQLLSATRSDHDWQAIPKRQDLARFFALIDELERRFPGRIELGPSREGRRAIERLVDPLGFSLAEDRRRGLVLVPKNDGGEEESFRRLAAQFLGFELERIDDRLAAGESWTVAIPSDHASSPLPRELWERATGSPMTTGALAALVRDQRLSLVIAGVDRLSSETRERLHRIDLRWVHDRVPFAFRRYAAAFTVENGRLFVPGGEAAQPAWRALVGARDDSIEELLQALLDVDRAKGAYLWHALRFAPPAAVDYFVGRGDAARGTTLRRVFDRLDASTGAFESSQSTQPGFETLVRSMPFAGDPPRPQLPGGPSLWLTAIEGETAPATREQAEAAARERAATELDDAELLMLVLTDQVNRLASDRRVLPRLLRGANLFRDHPEIFSPENVVLVARGSDTFAPALGVLDTLELRSPEIARDYLLAVARLDRLGSDWPREQLAMAFQGGVEWLHAMARAGRVESSLLEQELLAWSAIHARHDAAADATPDELAWTVRLLRALPGAADDAPGRGPLERAMLQAMVAPTEPRLSWKGLEYDSDRPRRLAAGMAEVLEFFAVPSADDLAAVHDALIDLSRSCAAEDLERAHRAAAALRSGVARLPGAPEPIDGAAPDVPRRLDNSRRDVANELAQDVLGRGRAKGLAGLLPRIEETTRSLAADLRPFLIAPAYVVPLAGGRGSLLQDRELVRKHQLTCAYPTQDRAWSEATLNRGQDGRPGVSICGHLATVDQAISSFTLSIAQLRTDSGLDKRRAQTWFRHLNTTRWHRFEPGVTGAVAAVLDLGWRVLDLALREQPGGPLLALATTVVPRARLERAARTKPALLSPGEAWMVGVAALDRTDGDAALADASDALGRARGALVVLGSDWRERIDEVGVPAPALNGRVSANLGWWPPYEAVDLEGRNQGLIERELVDLHLSIVGYLGRQGLPGFVGSDLMRRTMEDLVSTVELGHERDWGSVLEALRGLDDRYFEVRMRECLRQGLYRLRES
jgi:hypothetical protein